MPFSPRYLLVLIFLVAFLLAFIQVGILTIAFEKLGLSPQAGLLLLFASLFGSVINLPLFRVRAEPPPEEMMPPLWSGRWRIARPPFQGRTIIAVNLGGCVVPVGVSFYLIHHHPLNPGEVLLAVALISAVSFLVSRPIPGIGIGMPVFVAPLASAALALLLDLEHSAPLAYIAGTLGVLVGADLLRLPLIRRLGTPIAAIGGAGTFDGIFLTGIVAALLA